MRVDEGRDIERVPVYAAGGRVFEFLVMHLKGLDRRKEGRFEAEGEVRKDE